MASILDKILRMGEGRILRELERVAKDINAIEDTYVAMSDDELKMQTELFKQRLADGEELDDLLVEAFATVREAAKRVLGQRHFDVQLMGGAALHLGNIAEMKTGEGKTLVSTLPTYLNALTGDGVHIVTVNDYLAKYQSEWMGRIYHFLGMSVGVILSEMTPAERREAYASRRHLRHQQRARLRLPARQHGQPAGGLRPAGPPLRHRRRGRLHPDRRGADAADHLRPDPGRGQVVRRVRRARPRDGARRRLRGRREEAHRLGARARHHEGGEPPRHREPLRRGQHAADLVHEQRDQGQGAVPPRQGVRRPQRRGAHRRRAHRPHAARPPLQRRPAPGDRGQGGGDRPRGVPDPRDDHPAELLPDVREALRHDRHGDDRGLGIRQDLRSGGRADPDQHADGPHRPARPGVPHRGRQVRGRGRRHRGAQRQGAAGPGRHHLGREVRVPLRPAHAVRHPARGAERQAPRRRGEDRRGRRPQGSRDRRDQHGRPRHRHHAGWLGGVPGRPGAAPAGTRPGRDHRGVRSRLAGDGRAGQGPGLGRARRGQGSSAASTSSAPSGTSPGASTTSCVGARAARATRASPASTCRCKTT